MEREGFQMNTIAERIKFAMKAKNKKQVDIVKDTGISKGAFSSYLSGQYNPKADKMELIADSLDVDLRWLYGQNVPMENAQKDDTALQYVFYNNSCSEYLLDDLDDMYIAMKTQYSALIPRFYVLVNRAGNAMHILPLFLKEDSSQFYECPSDFFYSDRHTIFTRSAWNFQLSPSIIMELIQRLMNRKFPRCPTHKLTIAFISTMEYRAVT